MVEVIVTLAIVFVIAVMILPMIAKRHRKASRVSCTNNLKQIGLAFRIWAGDNNDKFPMQVLVTSGGAMEFAQAGSAYGIFLVMSNELNTPKLLICPYETNQKRDYATVFSPPLFGSNSSSLVRVMSPSNNISYFVGLDATEGRANQIIAGDDHFQINGKTPNPGLWLVSSNSPIRWRNERHEKSGNIAFADGSVGNFTNPKLKEVLTRTGFATNRLAMP